MESLEQRLVLSFTNSAISTSEAQSIGDGLDGLVTWADSVENHDLAGAILPVIGQALGASLDLSDALDQGLVQPVHDYFDMDTTPTTDELVTVLTGLTANLGNLSVTVDPQNVDGGLDTFVGGSEFVFNLVWDATRSLTTSMGLGPQGNALGIDFGGSANVALDFEITFDITFGLDLDSMLSAPDAFFVRVNQWDASASASAAGIASVGITAGAFDATVSGNMSLVGNLAAVLANPDSDARGNVTLTELTSTPLAQLVTFTPSGSSSGNLTLNVGSFGGFTPTLSPSISFSTSNPFEPVQLTLSGFDELLPFTNIDSTSVVGLLGQLGTWLNQLGGSNALDTAVELVSGQSLGELLNLDGSLAEGLLDLLLFDSSTPFEGVPKFNSVQGLATTLENVLGLSAGTINAQYDETTQELSYHVLIDHTFDIFQMPFDLGLELGPVVNIQTSSEVEFDVNVAFEFTFGFDLSRFRATVVAPLPAPTNGQLSADANFTLLAGANLPTNVTVTQAATSNNSDLDDLVDDINSALVAAGLGSQVGAARDATNDDHLTFFTKHIGPVVTLLFAADANDPSVTELGFDSNQFEFDTGFDDMFLEDASVSATAALDATDIDATLDLGYLQLNIVDGFAGADFSVDLQLQDPATQTPGGRVYLDDLFSAITTDVTQVITGPTLAGSLDATLPLMGVILGLPTAGNPNIAIEWTDFFGTQPTIDFNNMEDLFNFEHLSDDQIIGALAGISGFFADIQGFSFYDVEIPGLNVSLGEVFDYAERFLELVTGLSADPNGTLNELEAKIETGFGLNDQDLDLSLVDNDQVLRIDVSLGDTIMTQIPVNFDLSESLDNIVDVSGSAQLAASAGVQFDLSFGIDLTDPETPRPFLYESTGLELSAKALGSDIDFTTAWNAFGIFIVDGTFAVDGDGNHATPNDSVTLTVGLTDDDTMTTDGKLYLDEVDLSNVDVNLAGKVRATLPLFFPTASQFQGNIELTIDDLSDIGNTTTLEFPEQEMEEERDNFDMLNNLGATLDTVDFIVGVVQDAFNGEVFGVELPFLGSDFEKAAEFLEDFRSGFLQELRNRFQEANNKTPEVIRQALLDGLGPDGLDLLKDTNGSGTITTDDIVLTMADLDNDGEQDDSFEFDLTLEKQLAVLNESIAFDLGLPALGLDVDGNVELGLGLNWRLKFGVDRENGFFIDTSVQDEISIGLEARIPDLAVQGNLAFLQVDVLDEDADSNPNNVGVDVDQDGRFPSEFLAGLTIDILDPVDDPMVSHDDNKLTFDDVATGDFELGELVTARLAGTATVNLDLELSINGDKRFPSISSELTVVWPFATSDPDLTGSTPTVKFEDVRLNVGEFVNDFAASVLGTVQEFTEPVQPIVDFLTTPIPVISDFGQEVTPLVIAEQIATAYGYEFVTDFIGAVADIITLVNSIPTVSDTVYIPMGSFDLLGTDPRNEEDLQDVTPNVTQQVDPMMELEMADMEAKGFYDEMHDIGIFLPIIEDPSQLFGLFLGQQVDLFLYDMPELKFEVPFPIIRIGPVIPPYPVFVSFTGAVGVRIDLGFGFDTSGWEIYQETNDVLDIFSGFFISDRENADGTGEDVVEAALYGRLDAAVDVSIFFVSAGAGGGVTLELGADLRDPDGDGRVHFNELLDNIERGVTCTFDLQGEVFVELFTFIEFLSSVRFEFRSPKITLVDFELTDEDCYPDRFQSNDSQMSSTDLGLAPGLHVEGLSLESAGDQDWYQFELLRTDDIDVNVRHSQANGNVDLEVYNAAGQRIASGTSNKDGEVVRLKDALAGIYFARVTGSGQLNNYKFIVEPSKTSSTRMIYVSPPGEHYEDVSFHTWASGSDAHDGLTASQPKATLQSVLDTYDLGPNDMVVFETGDFGGPSTMLAEDSGAIFFGSIGGSSLGRLTLQGAQDNWFVALTFTDGSEPPAYAGGAALVTLNSAHGHVFEGD